MTAVDYIFAAQRAWEAHDRAHRWKSRAYQGDSPGVGDSRRAAPSLRWLIAYKPSVSGTVSANRLSIRTKEFLPSPLKLSPPRSSPLVTRLARKPRLGCIPSWERPSRKLGPSSSPAP